MQEVGEQLGKSTGKRADLGDAIGGCLKLVRHVEPGHLQRAAVFVDHRGGFRVGPDVELGCG
ncbi:unannotated protein [freshwater metagenome]|uniref:Unannotated protein n=1 Tax=freshwater metagenome TaxID=449393 RepID=A0A6J6YQT0_9ZZZZ